jgi:hypothetical protein
MLQFRPCSKYHGEIKILELITLKILLDLSQSSSRDKLHQKYVMFQSSLNIQEHVSKCLKQGLYYTV